MGIYFIAAGIRNNSKNRGKSLDKCFFSTDLNEYIPDDIFIKLEAHFPNGKEIYLWGANKGRSYEQLKNASPGEYVVDVKIRKLFKYSNFAST